ncbi:MAG: hypothetical protein WBC20_11855 [Candidatus Aminicenantaceae bacterium]
MASENNIKKELKEHLEKAVQLQTEIETLTGKVLEELNKANESIQKLGEVGLEAEEKVVEEEKEEVEAEPEVEEEPEIREEPEIKAEVPEGEKEEEVRVDFEQELAKVKRVKKMLEEQAEPEVKEEEVAVEPSPPEEAVEETVEEKPLPEEEKEPGFEAEGTVEVYPSYMDKEEIVEEEPEPEEEKAPDIEAKETVEYTTSEEEKEPDIQVGEGVEPSPTEKEIEEALEENSLPAEEEEPSVEGSEAMETLLSGRWKKHWQEKVMAAAEEEGEKEEAPEEAEPQPEEAKEEAPEVVPLAEEIKEEPEEPAFQPEEVKEEVPEAELQPEEETVPSTPEGEEGDFQGRRASDVAEALVVFKKTEPPEEGAEIYYYEKDEKTILDSECIIQSLDNHLEEAKKLFIKLSQTEAPKDQFFVKQEIIRHQEAVRSALLIGERLLEKESCSLPKITNEIVNESFLKEILEKLSMENWSNQDNFTFFDEYAGKIKRDFEAMITPKVDYLKSILEELEA